MTTTSTVTFSADDIDLLYSIPRPGGDLATIIRTFVFLNRSAAPSFSVLHSCFTKAIQSGILLENGGQYQVAQDWYQRIHAYDDSAGNEIESLLAFQDEFIGVEVPVLINTQVGVTERDYEKLVRGLQR